MAAKQMMMTGANRAPVSAPGISEEPALHSETKQTEPDFVTSLQAAVVSLAADGRAQLDGRFTGDLKQLKTGTFSSRWQKNWILNSLRTVLPEALKKRKRSQKESAFQYCFALHLS